jgi:hypothetical protein
MTPSVRLCGTDEIGIWCPVAAIAVERPGMYLAQWLRLIILHKDAEPRDASAAIDAHDVFGMYIVCIYI